MLQKIIVRALTVCLVLCAGITGANGQESYLDVEQIVAQPLSLTLGLSTTLDMGLFRHPILEAKPTPAELGSARSFLKALPKSRVVCVTR